MESELTNASQGSAAFMVLDSQEDSANVNSNKLFDTLTALKGVSDEQKDRSLPYPPRKCELPNSAASKPFKKSTTGEGSDSSNQAGNPPSENPPSGREGGDGGEQGGSAGGGGGGGDAPGGSGAGGNQGGDDGPSDHPEDEEETHDEEEEATEETPTSSANSGNSVPDLVRPASNNGHESEDQFAVPEAPADREQQQSESEGGISDAPTAVVSDTEGHGQIITGTKSSSSRDSPGAHNVSTSSNESPRAPADLSSAVSTMSSSLTSSTDASETEPPPPKKRMILKRPKPKDTSTKKSSSDTDPKSTTTSAADTSDKSSDRTHDMSDKSHDISDKSQDASDQSHDISDKSQDTSDRSHAASDKSFNTSDKSNDASDKSHSGSNKSTSDKPHDASHKSISDKPHDASHKSKSDKSHDASDKSSSDIPLSSSVKSTLNKSHAVSDMLTSDKSHSESDKPQGSSTAGKSSSDKPHNSSEKSSSEKKSLDPSDKSHGASTAGKPISDKPHSTLNVGEMSDKPSSDKTSRDASDKFASDNKSHGASDKSKEMSDRPLSDKKSRDASDKFTSDKKSHGASDKSTSDKKSHGTSDKSTSDKKSHGTSDKSTSDKKSHGTSDKSITDKSGETSDKSGKITEKSHDTTEKLHDTTEKLHDISDISSKDTSDFDISASQTDLFSGDDPDETREHIHEPDEDEDDDDSMGTPAEKRSNLQPSANPVVVPETFEESLNMIPPSLNAYESVPTMVPSSAVVDDSQPEETESEKPPEKKDEDSKGSDQNKQMSRSSSSSSKPISTLQQWQPSLPTDESSITPPDKVDPQEETESSKISESLNLKLSETERETCPSEKPETQESCISPKSSVEVIEISSGKSTLEEPKDVAEIESSQEDLALHYSQTQGDTRDPTQFTVGLDTMTEAKKPEADDLDGDATEDEEVLLLEPVDIPTKTGEETKSNESTPKKKPGVEEKPDKAKPAQPSLTLDMIDTEETQDPDDEAPAPVFRLDRPSVDSQLLDESLKEESVFQRTGEKKTKSKPQSSRSSNSEDPFEFSQGRQLRDHVASTSLFTQKDRALLDKRQGNEKKEGSAVVVDKTNELSDSVEMMEVDEDEEEAGEPTTCPMSAKPVSEETVDTKSDKRQVTKTIPDQPVQGTATDKPRKTADTEKPGQSVTVPKQGQSADVPKPYQSEAVTKPNQNEAILKPDQSEATLKPDKGSVPVEPVKNDERAKPDEPMDIYDAETEQASQEPCETSDKASASKPNDTESQTQNYDFPGKLSAKDKNATAAHEHRKSLDDMVKALTRARQEAAKKEQTTGKVETLQDNSAKPATAVEKETPHVVSEESNKVSSIDRTKNNSKSTELEAKEKVIEKEVLAKLPEPQPIEPEVCVEPEVSVEPEASVVETPPVTAADTAAPLVKKPTSAATRRTPAKSRKRQRRTPARPARKDTSESDAPPAKQPAPAEPAPPAAKQPDTEDVYDLRLSQSQKEAEELDRIKNIREIARKKRALYEKRDSACEPTTSAGLGVGGEHAASRSRDVHPRTTPLITPYTTPPLPIPLISSSTTATRTSGVNRQQTNRYYNVVTVKTTYEQTRTTVEEVVDGRTTDIKIDENWTKVNEVVDHSIDVVERSPSRRASGSLSSGDMGDISSFSHSSSNRASLTSFGSRRSSRSSAGGSFPPTTSANIIGELRPLPDPRVTDPFNNRRLSEVTALAATETILSPRRSHGLSFDDRTVHEETFAHGVSKRSSVAQGVDVTSGHFTAPSGVPFRQERERPTRRGNTRTRGGRGGANLFETSEESPPSGHVSMAGETSAETTVIPPTGHSAMAVPETSVTSVPDTSMSTVLELVTAGQRTVKGGAGGRKRSHSRSSSSRQASDAESLVADTDTDKPALSLPVATPPVATPTKSGKKKGKGRRKANTPKKKPEPAVAKEPSARQSQSSEPGDDLHLPSTPAAPAAPSPATPTTVQSVASPGGSTDPVDLPDLNLTPPHTPLHTMEVGTQVMALWKDKHYYSGFIKQYLPKSGHYKIVFDDGNMKNNLSNAIIVCKLLPVGHIVMAEKGDWQEQAVIKGHFKQGDSYGYIVEFESGTITRLPKSLVSLDTEQATAVLEHPVPLIAEPSQSSSKKPAKSPQQRSPQKSPKRSPQKSAATPVKTERSLLGGESEIFSQDIAPSLSSVKSDDGSGGGGGTQETETGMDVSEFVQPARVTPNRQPQPVAVSPYKPNIKPYLHTTDSALEPSTPVMALWTDKHYYPGTVVKQDTSGRYEVRFEDGDVRHVIESEIIVCELLSIGQGVYAENEAGVYVSALVMDHYRRGPEIGYVVEFDDGGRKNVPRARVTINLEQANILFGNLAGPACTPIGAKAFDISLDNLVAGKRRRAMGAPPTPSEALSDSPGVSQPKEETINTSAVKRSTTKKPSVSEEPPKAPPPAKAPAVAAQAAESTPVPPPVAIPESSASKDAKKTSTRKASTTGKRKGSAKGKGAKRKAPEKPEPAPVEEKTEEETRTPAKKRKLEPPMSKPPAASPETPKSKRRLISQDSPGEVGDQSPRYLSQSPGKSSDDKLLEIRGPIPAKGSRIFHNMVFILTHAEKAADVLKTEQRLIRQSPLHEFSASESSSYEEDSQVPFDKIHLQTQIEAGGGCTLGDMKQLHTVKGQCFLISDSCQRTVKYICSLAAGIHCISHVWIRDSCKMGKLLDYNSYTLPAGFDCDYKRAVEWNAEHRPLEGLKTYISSAVDSFVANWSVVLKTAGCHILDAMPTKASTQAGKGSVDLVVGDTSTSPAVTSQAAAQGVPVVSSEWVIQCLIHGHRLPFLSHPRFKHDYQVQ